ncbi:hypothetical protein PF005_g15477 [Phytophthora fragariae]|uniref:Prostaglandin E synthase 2 n=1 Tax=Phytophthora fragariae TaxID=53985 RepID=A0A6A3TMI8_9STRA|nr:hypothetical protein PF009_g14446 [Phytophthora fragariae]KAE9105727.1 hypothetical protein PF010_g12890 [Phytophthora fragariae]KAE9106385.1 hypothetical protein PF007_g13419 [Phytophthora fragariae]KAE9139363.1 hypothetical protein PF006_g13759 [Phytophthora fragariae]KAE9200116.1 hypothetical protein PF005_g15477 [Phytophthora fragariae]
MRGQQSLPSRGLTICTGSARESYRGQHRSHYSAETTRAYRRTSSFPCSDTAKRVAEPTDVLRSFRRTLNGNNKMLQRGVVRLGRASAALSRPSASKSFASASARFSSSRLRSVVPIASSPLLQRVGLVAAASTSAACAFCSAPAAVAKDGGNALPNVVLYQYEPCPYCCKVKAVLDYLNIPYEVVEVNPLSKKETKAFTDYRKVPVVRINDEVVVDSSAIISRLRELVPAPEGSHQQDEEALQEEEQWRQWVDKKLIILTPPNIYRTVPEALQAFDYCLTEGKFTPMERRMSKYTGAVIMYLIAKRSKKKYGIEDERQSLYSALGSWVEAIGDKRPFLGGDEPNMADLSVFGVLRAMHGLDTYNDMMRETNIEPWFTRMTAKVGSSLRTASN